MGWQDRLKQMDRGLARTPKGIAMVGAPATPGYILDQVGKPLGVGDQVLVVPQNLLMTVAAITPAVHPGMPPGHLMVKLATHLSFVAPGGGATEGIYRIHTAEEIVAAMQAAGTAGAAVEEAPSQPSADGAPAVTLE